MTVINTIRRHGKRDRIARFSVYFLHCVQEHMRHHGEEYLQAAKAPRAVGAILPGAMRKMSLQNGADRTVEVLAETHRVLSRRGRIQRGKKSASGGDLFSLCKGSAQRAQRGGKVPQTFALSADSGIYSSNVAAVDRAIPK